MVQHRNPMMNAVGPVVANRGGLAIFVVGENQAVFRFAVIEDLDNVNIARTGGLRKIKVELAVSAKERGRTPVENDSIDGQVSEVDIDLARWFDDGQINARARGCDFRELIVERDVDEVMCWTPSVDQALDARSEGRGGKQ